MTAMPILVAILCLMAIAYRYYSAFIAAKVATLDDLRTTPAVQFNDGQNYHPTNKWVLFGHHFAAISGAGPLIGPVLAAQFGYLPGLLWIVIGVCLGGAVQDFLVLAASVRRGGKSLAQIAYMEIGKTAGNTAMAAILFIIIIALAGLGKVVVNALGGEEVKYPADSRLVGDIGDVAPKHNSDETLTYVIPSGTMMYWGQNEEHWMTFNAGFDLKTPVPLKPLIEPAFLKPSPKDERLPDLANPPANPGGGMGTKTVWPIPAGSVRLTPGSAWGTFTIFCTIPIALFVGFYMYRIRKGRVIEASIIGAVLTLGATFIGGFITGSRLEPFFNLQSTTVIYAMATYGFIASVLPLWVLLVPRDYLSSFLKIGTIGLLVIGTIIANPTLHAPAFNHVFSGGGPIVPGKIFPFLFITIMCGAISGFHALVSSGTTPKMVAKEGDARMIGYGAMLIEGLVAVVAMIAASTLPVMNYYAMNTKLGDVPKFQQKLAMLDPHNGTPQAGDTLELDEVRTQESLRGRTGGAVTLAVGMARIFDDAARRISDRSEALLNKMVKYWYHFAIMFEALFILTTIDAGTRIGRFLLQEVAGKIHPKLGETNWWPGAIVSTLLIVVAWGYFINSNSFAAIWVMFGIANQMLAVIALAIVSTCIVNEGKKKYLWVTACPLIVVMTTTSTAAVENLLGMIQTIRTQLAKPTPDAGLITNSTVAGVLTIAMLACAYVIVISAVKRIWPKIRGEQGGFPIAASEARAV